MSGDEFQSRYSGVMEAMLRSAVAETSQLFQTMVEELKAEMSLIKKENEELRSKCRHFEKKAMMMGDTSTDTATTADGGACSSVFNRLSVVGSPGGACCGESNSNNEPGLGGGPPRSDLTKCDTAIQCDLVPLQVAELYSGTDKALEGEKRRSGSLNPIASEEIGIDIGLASSNGEPAALQQDQRDTSEAPDQPDTAGDNEPSCEGGTRSQASGPENPPVVTPLRLVEKIEPQSQQISASTPIASATENLPGSIHTKEKPDTAGDNETSREGGTRSQASGPENPPLLPLVEKMEQKSQQISALTLIASATATEKTATESTLTKEKPDAAGDNESRCKGGTGPENPPDVTPLPLEEKMEPQSQQDSALTLIASPNPPASTSTKEKPVVTPAVEDHVAEVKVIVQPARRRGRPPKVRLPPTDVLVEQRTEKSTSARAEKIEICRPPAMSVSRRRGRPLKKPRPSTIKWQAEESVESPLHVVPAAHTAANHPESAHIEDEETEDYAPLSPLSDGEQMDEATLPSLEIPSTPETSSTEAPKSPSPVPPSSTKFNRSISYPTLEDAMLLIDAMNARTIEGDDATIGNKPSVLRTTSKLAKPQRSPSQVTSQKSDPQSGPGDIEASAAPTLPSPTVTRQTGAKPPTTEPTVAQPPAQQFTLRVNSQSTAVSPNQPSNAVAQVQTLVMIPTTHYAIVSPQNNGPAAMVPVGRRITVVTPKFPRVMSPPKIVVMPRSMSSHVGPRMLLARPQAQLSTAATVSTTVVSAQNTCSPAVTSAGDQPSTQAAAVPTVTLKAMGVTPAQSLSSVPPQATANSSSHSENNARPQMVVLPQQMSVVTPGPHRSNDTTTQTSTANSASTSSLKCDVVTLTKTNAEDKKPVAVPLAQPSPLLSYESSATVSTQTFFDRLKNVVTTLSQKCDNLTSSSKNNSEDSKSVAVPLAQPCPLSTQTSMVNLATTLSQKCDDLASTESNAARSKMTTAPTETCSSLTRLTSSTDAQTAMPLPPVSPKKMVVKLTMLSLPALRKEILKLKRSPVKKQTDASVLQNVPSVVQEVPLAEVESSQTSPAREQDIAPVSVTQPSSKECPITVQVQASVPPKVPTVVQEKPAAAAAAKSSQPTTSADDEESTSTQASFVLKEDTSHGCATAAPDTAIPETPSGAMLRLSSVISKDLGDPHLEMTKVQFLAQLAVTPVAQVQERAPFNGLTDKRASVGTNDKKGVDENTHLKRRGSHRKPLLNPCKTRLHPAASQMEAQPMPATAKKARSDGDAEPETPAIKTSRRESSSSPRAAHKSSRESIPTGPEKSDTTKNGSRLKKANDAHPPVGIRRSRSSKNTGSSERTTNENEPHGPVSPRSTREGNRKRSNEPTPLGVQRPTLIQDAVRPKKRRLADVKLAAAANTKPSTKAARTKRLPQATGAKKMARAQMFANNAQKRSKKPTDAQTSTSVASAEKSTKADNAKRSAKATTSKAFSKPANVKNVKTARAVKRQRVPKAVKAKTVVKTENEESEIEPEFADQHSQSEGESSQSANNKFCQTGKRIWTVPRTEARGRKRLSVNRLNNNDARSQTPKTPPDTPVRAAAACRPPTPIVSPLQPLAVIGGRLLKNQCGECGRLLGSAAALESHVSLHTFRTPFSCQHCGKSFPDAKCLSRHGRVHRNGRIHVCAECGKGFVYTFGLTKHLQMVHGTVKPFACQFCTKGFHTRRDLDMHTRIHTGEKPFECSLCEKKFKRKVELNVHLRWHNGEKRHWCPYCGKGFLDRNNLKVHKLIHTGEKPHACTLCPKKFTQTGHLKKHLKNVHKV